MSLKWISLILLVTLMMGCQQGEEKVLLVKKSKESKFRKIRTTIIGTKVNFVQEVIKESAE